jgi:hypothetical protein
MKDPLFTFEEDGHTYKYDGKRVTGITTIIGVLAKPALIGWAAKMAVEYIKENGRLHESSPDGDPAQGFYIISKEHLEEAKSAHTKKKEDAGQKGTDMHALVEEWINLNLAQKGGDFTVRSDEDTQYFLAIVPFIEWAQENVDHFLFSERRMFNKDLFIAGTCDFAYIDKQGRRVVSDFKTSGSGIYYEMWIQTAAYQLIAEAEGDEKYDYRTIVRLDKKGGFEFQERHDYETDKDAFLSALKLYRAMATYKKV